MEKFNCLIPIGSWCRPAWQINRFKVKHGAKSISYPFDWCITPLHSLEKIFSHSYDINQLSISMNAWRDSAPKDITPIDATTGLIFSHDKTVEEAKGRFLHTFKNLLLTKEKNNLIFIRWLDKYGHDHRKRWGEDRNPTYEKLIENLKIFINNDTFKLIEIETEYNDVGDLIRDKKQIHDKLIRYILTEPVYVDPVNNGFRGSDKSWDLILNDIIEDYGKL
jgi:hypothetical protein